jgi:hypothetical protein
MSAAIISCSDPLRTASRPSAMSFGPQSLASACPRRAAARQAMGEKGRVERRHHDAAAASIGDEALGLQKAQSLMHRLARDIEPLGQLILGEALPRRQLAIADRVQDFPVNTVG